MVRRRRKWRKRFDCNHKGFGRYCHRCIRIDSEFQPLRPASSKSTGQSPKTTPTRRTWKSAKQLAAKRFWQQSFAADPIDLTHLPKPIVIQTRRILESLNQGVPPAQLKGKRFNFDRTLMRIPVTYRYRLLCRWYSDRIIPLQVLTHEAYNAIAHNKKQAKGS